MERTEQLLAFLYRIPVAVIELDSTGEIGLMNPVAAQYLLPLTGGKPPKNLVSLLEPYLPELRERMEGFREPSGLVIGEQRFLVGHRHYTLELRKVEDGLYMAAISDVTEAHEREQRVQAAVAQEAEQRGRSEIAAGVLHDIGNAVTALGTTVARALSDLDWPELVTLERVREFLLQRQGGVEEALGGEKAALLFDLLQELRNGFGEHREEMESALNEMAGTLTHISEILTIQRTYTSERPDILGRTVDLRKVMDDAIEMQAVSLSNREISVQRRYTEGSLLVQGDRTKLVRVAMNLLRNSAEAFDRELGERKDRLIRISSRSEGGEVTILIEDNGPGFSPTQGGPVEEETAITGTASSKGLVGGQGLRGVSRMIEAHGGKLERGKSDLGGALLRFSLPLKEEKEG